MLVCYLNHLTYESARSQHTLTASLPSFYPRGIDQSFYAPSEAHQKLLTCKLQVPEAFALLQKSQQADFPDVRYEVKVRRSDSSVNQRGVYLRDPLESAQPTSHVIDVTPKLREVGSGPLDSLCAVYWLRIAT